MSEEFARVQLPNSKFGEVIFAVYEAVEASSVLRIAYDGETKLVYDGSVYGTPTDYTFFEHENAFIIVEPVVGYQGGADRWQYLLSLHNGRLYSVGSFTNTFDATTKLFSPDLSTDWQEINNDDNGFIQMWIMISDTEYPYLKFIVEQYTHSQYYYMGEYVGGYTPFSSNDEKPVCFLNNYASAAPGDKGWGVYTKDSNNHNRVPLEYAHTTRMADTGYANVEMISAMRDSYHVYQTYDGVIVAVPLYILKTQDNILGVFSPLNMVGSCEAIPDKTVDVDHSILHLAGLAHRWVEP